MARAGYREIHGWTRLGPVVLQRLDLRHATSVTRSAAELSGEKALDQLQSERRADDVATDTRDVHRVVFDPLMRGKDIMNERGAHARHFVRRDGRADAAAAKRHAARDLAGGNGPGEWDDEVG